VCNIEQTTTLVSHYPSRMNSLEHNKNAARQFWDEVFNKGNFNALGKMSPDYQYNGGAQSNEAFIGWVTGLRAALPDLHVVIDEILAEDNKVALRWHMKGTASGKGGFAAGTLVEWTGTNILVNNADGFCMANDQNGQASFTHNGITLTKTDAELYSVPACTGRVAG
jgi:predicted ester cyclase